MSEGPFLPRFSVAEALLDRGVYLNLVEGRLWVPDVVSSNPTTPTDFPSQPVGPEGTRQEPFLLS
jgi:hypothetical protein